MTVTVVPPNTSNTKLQDVAKKHTTYINSSSMQRTTTPLRLKPPEPVPQMPSVYYTKEVWESITYLVDKCTQEIGWLGLVEEYQGWYLVTEIFIPEQEVSSATTDIEPEALAALTMQLLDEGKDPNQLRYWGHSHVNMQVSPSTTDELQIQEYLQDVDFFIRGIYNKKGDSKVDVYDVRTRHVHQCVFNDLYVEAISDKRKKELDELLKTNVKQYQPPSRLPYYDGYQYGGYNNLHQNNGYGNQQVKKNGESINGGDLTLRTSTIKDVEGLDDLTGFHLTELEEFETYLDTLQDPFGVKEF